MADHPQWKPEDRVVLGLHVLWPCSVHRTMPGTYFIDWCILFTRCFFRNAGRCHECTGCDDRTEIRQTDHDFVPRLLQYRNGIGSIHSLVVQRTWYRPSYTSCNNYSA